MGIPYLTCELYFHLNLQTHFFGELGVFSYREMVSTEGTMVGKTENLDAEATANVRETTVPASLSLDLKHICHWPCGI